MKYIYHYDISSTGENSKRYGVCDVCKKHCSEVFIQTEQREYVRPDGSTGLTGDKCNPIIFGHEQCLLSKRH